MSRLNLRELPDSLIGVIYMCAAKFVMLMETENKAFEDPRDLSSYRDLLRFIRRYSRVRDKRPVNGDYKKWQREVAHMGWQKEKVSTERASHDKNCWCEDCLEE